MSRSYQKHPHGKVGDKGYKKIYNRKLRRQKDLELPSGSAYKKVNSSYDICDYNCDTSIDSFFSWPWIENKFDNEEEAMAYWKAKYGSK
jgi:hypothetical protein